MTKSSDVKIEYISGMTALTMIHCRGGAVMNIPQHWLRYCMIVVLIEVQLES